ncbi:MAG TPA: ABC transporter substrate-binding protein [Pantoea sp.]|uniref:ABC transporter substrate-binding protein n=1 Tax=Pantoea TaxID=53335 RepID=UPI000BB55212|nr:MULTISPECIES: ABC transporter substrate-binding protein [Pantoea]PNK64967.1 aliphatic sulfonate ABC transporter substrate-binding protein [Pantoea sp. FDAARGOS_194]HAK33693.1 ABC transporter substrate-binding protein [Pantoea sp.]
MRLAALFAGVALALSLNSAFAAEKVTLRLGDVKGDRFASLKASGELDNLPYDLKLTAFDSGAPVQEALNAGALDVGFTGDLPFLFVYAAGAPVKAVGAWQNNPDSIALLTRPDAGIQSLKDLKGKQIAVNRGGWGHYLILGLLERAGLKPDEVTLRFLGPVDGRAALTSGAVSAWAPWEPYIATSTQIDGTVRVPQGGGNGIMSGYSYALARKEALANPEKRKAIADLLTRLAKAQVWAAQHPQPFAQALSKTLNMPTTITSSWIDDARIRPLVFDPSLIATLQKSADFFHRYQVLPKAVNVSDAFDFSLASGANQVARHYQENKS